MQTRAVKAHQLLYGYDDGHRLLAGSFCPEPRVARALLALSDLSDSAQLGSSHSYITGYPFLREGFYALCKTWPAPEMKRPGCVWTHILVLETHELARLEDPDAVLQSFFRPDNLNHNYSHPVDVYRRDRSHPQNTYELSAVYWVILKNLYGKPDEPLNIFFTESGVSLEHLAVSIWLQQWPRLRRSFSFSTQGGDSQSTAGFKFDFQLASGVRAYPTRSIPLESLLQDHDVPHWAELLAHDLCQRGSMSPLRHFLRRHGAEVGRGREAMRPLVACFLAVNSHDAKLAEAAVKTSQHLRPKPSSLFRSLGTHLLNGGMTGGILGQFVRDNVEVIAGPRSNDAELMRLSLLLRETGDSKVWSLLGSEVEWLSRIGALAVEGASPDKAYRNLSQCPEAYLRVLAKYPRLAATSQLWEENYAREAAAVVAKAGRARRDVLRAMYGAQNPDIPAIAADIFGFRTAGFCLEILNRGEYTSTSERWVREICKKYESVMVRSIAHGGVKSAEGLAFAAEFLPADHPSTWVDRDEWVSGIRRLGRTPEIASLSVFLLTRALSGASPEPAALLSLSFSDVHESAWWSDFDARLWQRMLPYLPAVPVYKEWDRCHRIRLAVIEGFIRGKFPLSSFFSVAASDRSFAQLVDTARDMEEGKKVLYSAAQLPEPEKRSQRKRWKHVRRLVDERTI